MRFVSSEGMQPTLARKKGPRAVEWYEHSSAFKLESGSGQLATWMIRNAPLFVMATRWFDRYCMAYPRRNSALVEAAMIKRIRDEGITPEGCAFLAKHTVHSPDETHEWLIGEFEDHMRQLRNGGDRPEK